MKGKIGGRGTYLKSHPWSSKRLLVERIYLLFTLLWFGLIFFIHSRFGELILLAILVAGNIFYVIFISKLGDRVFIVDLLHEVNSWCKKYKQSEKDPLA
jgi:hypothetical protein